MREIALHLLDIAQNSIAAGAKRVSIVVEEDHAQDRLRAIVEDDGCGMDADLLARISDPFVTSRTTRKVGLGIPLLKAAAEACNGRFDIVSSPGQGARVGVTFQLSHVDRMPLGDLAGTFLTLVVGCPDVDWLFRYRVNGAEFVYDHRQVRGELGDVPVTEPSILAFVREYLQSGISEAKQAGTEKQTAFM